MSGKLLFAPAQHKRPLAELRDQFAELAQNVSRIQAAIDDAETEIERSRARHQAGCDRNGEDHLLALAQGIIRARSVRHRLFPVGLLSDPAWDMLLDVFVARLTRRAICVSSLCIAARVPATTALRWIRLLEADGALVRRADPDDRRRVLIEIGDCAYDAVARALLAYPDPSSSRPA